MRVVVQRVKRASVRIGGELHSSIEAGLLILLGVEDSDESSDIEWLVKKCANLRIFDDENGVMNRSLIDMNGEVMIVSQFTLMASTKKGNRPSYIRAAGHEHAVPMYEAFLPSFFGGNFQNGGYGCLRRRHAGRTRERRAGNDLYGYEKQGVIL